MIKLTKHLFKKILIVSLLYAVVVSGLEQLAYQSLGASYQSVFGSGFWNQLMFRGEILSEVYLVIRFLVAMMEAWLVAYFYLLLKDKLPTGTGNQIIKVASVVVSWILVFSFLPLLVTINMPLYLALMLFGLILTKSLVITIILVKWFNE